MTTDRCGIKGSWQKSRPSRALFGLDSLSRASDSSHFPTWCLGVLSGMSSAAMRPSAPPFTSSQSPDSPTLSSFSFNFPVLPVAAISPSTMPARSRSSRPRSLRDRYAHLYPRPRPRGRSLHASRRYSHVYARYDATRDVSVSTAYAIWFLASALCLLASIYLSSATGSQDGDPSRVSPPRIYAARRQLPMGAEPGLRDVRPTDVFSLVAAWWIASAGALLAMLGLLRGFPLVLGGYLIAQRRRRAIISWRSHSLRGRDYCRDGGSRALRKLFARHRCYRWASMVLARSAMGDCRRRCLARRVRGASGDRAFRSRRHDKSRSSR